jgi:peptidoglycan hydrolase-like protein with peptidoglycan-binding domain
MNDLISNLPETDFDISLYDTDFIKQVTKQNTSYIPASSMSNQNYGDDNAQVLAVQIILRDLEYISSDQGISGYYGEITQGSVEAFQSDNNLNIDGQIGPATWEALAREYNNVAGVEAFERRLIQYAEREYNRIDGTDETL